MLIGYRSSNHPQQTRRRGANDDVDDRGTTAEVFGPINERFGFTLDVAAAPHNAKVERFVTREVDGLAASWAGERIWCNPPYSNLHRWLDKAWSEWASPTPPQLIVMLLPANRTEQGWWQDMVEPYRDRPGSPLRTEMLRGRLRFIRHGLGHSEVKPNERPPFGCCLLIWQATA